MTASCSTSVCLICNASCSSSRNTVQIFHKDVSVTSEVNIPTILEQILDTEIIQDNIHSEILCKKCFKLIDEYDEIRNRMFEISKELHNNYKVNLETRENEQIEDINDGKLQETSSRQSNALPKKILDIPSSDDESGHVIEKPLESLDDIEMALVKLHGDTMDDMESEGQAFQALVGSDCEELEVHPELADKIKIIKLEPNHKDDSYALAQSSIGMIEGNKPNILKKRASVNGIAYTNIIIQEATNKFKTTEEESTNPIVSRDGNMYTCLICTEEDALTDVAKAIIAHMKEVHDSRLYICDVCGMDFRKRNLLSAHVDEHVANEEGDFQCEVCNRIFTNLRLFRIHRRMHLPPAKAWSCTTCAKKFSSKNLLKEHINMHLGVRPYICGTCGKDFASKYTFKAHEKTHENRPRPYRCEQCGKSFLSQQNLTQHERTHSSVKEYQCHLCDKQFGSANNLEVHSVVHTGYKPFVCGLCGKTFARKAEVKDHERTHTGERPFQCEFCGATFSQRSNLQTHKRATHYDDKRYKCSDCGKCFKRRRLLDYHTKAAHTGERPYKCEICESTFVYPEHFKKHRRIHTGEKPFLCEVCGKAFNSRDNRNAHRFVHSDKKPYECLVCGAGFMRKPLLYQHMQAQGHLNDTIVVNQPRLTLDDKLAMDAESHLVNVQDDTETNESKLFISGEEGAEHIIIDGCPVALASSENEEEEEEEDTEVMDDMEQVVTTEEGDYDEFLTAEALASSETQIIQTPDGPIQLVKVKIPQENGEEEEAWIKIIPE